MEYNDIKKLIDDMGNANIDELNIEFPEGTKISMKKNQNNNVNTNVGVDAHIDPITNNKTETTIEPKQEQTEGKIVKSPMVGTFYSKPSPDANEYVKVGDKVSKGDVLCIVEAMKLMNEIESEFSGEIVEILVKEGEAVEYGTPMFKIK